MSSPLFYAYSILGLFLYMYNIRLLYMCTTNSHSTPLATILDISHYQSLLTGFSSLIERLEKGKGMWLLFTLLTAFIFRSEMSMAKELFDTTPLVEKKCKACQGELEVKRQND